MEEEAETYQDTRCDAKDYKMPRRQTTRRKGLDSVNFTDRDDDRDDEDDDDDYEAGSEMLDLLNTKMLQGYDISQPKSTKSDGTSSCGIPSGSNTPQQSAAAGIFYESKVGHNLEAMQRY